MKEKDTGYREILVDKLSEKKLIILFEEKLKHSGDRIEFSLGERPAKNFFKGKGVIRSEEGISDHALLVIETDMMSNEPFNIESDLIVWRKMERESIDRVGLDRPFIRVSRHNNDSSLLVQQGLPYMGGEETIGYFPEAKELLNAWIEGRKSPAKII